MLSAPISASTPLTAPIVSARRWSESEASATWRTSPRPGSPQRRGESLDELRGQPLDESDRVDDEVPLAVVLEPAGSRIERLEQAIVDRRLGPCERVQGGGLPDVRVSGQCDGRRVVRTRSLRLVERCPSRAAEPLLEERDPRAGEASVGLELTLTWASSPDAAPEALEVLPQAPHARQVVLELRQLDLELALRAACVLREDVEDQLRAVDDTRLQLVFQGPLLCRAQLVVDEQRFGVGVGERLRQLRQLPLPDERARIRVRAILDDLADRLDARRPRELRELAELVGRIRALGKTARRSPRSGSAPGAGSGWRAVTANYAAVRSGGDRARRPSRRADARTRRHPLAERPGSRHSRTRARARPTGLDGRLRRRRGLSLRLASPQERPPRRARRALRHRAGAGQSPGPPRRRRGSRSRRERHEGWSGGRARARTRRRSRGARTTSACCSSDARSSGRAQPASCSLRGVTVIHETTLAVVLEPTDLELQSGARQRRRVDSCSTGRAATSARPGSPTAHLERAVRGLSRCSSRAASGGGRRDCEFREVVSVTRLDAGIADNVIPGEATATLNLPYPPDREPPRPSTTSRASSRRRDPRDRQQCVAGACRHRRGVRTSAPGCGRSRRPPEASTGPNVADFTARGLDAVNFGPGTPLSPTMRTERVAVELAVRAYDVLRRFLTSPIGKMARDGSRGAHRRSCGSPGSSRRSRSSSRSRSRLRRGARRGARRRRLGGERMGEEGHPPLLPPAQGRTHGERRPALSRQDPGKSDYASRGVRVVPPGVARYGSFLSEGVVLMPASSTSAPGSGRGRWSTRGRRSDRVRRSEPTSTCPAESASAGARAAPGASRHRRGRRIPRLPRGGRRGRARSAPVL